jgi:hypothetical protein
MRRAASSAGAADNDEMKEHIVSKARSEAQCDARAGAGHAKLKVEMWPTSRPIPYARNARVCPQSAIEKVATSIREYGFRQPSSAATSWWRPCAVPSPTTPLRARRSTSPSAEAARPSSPPRSWARRYALEQHSPPRMSARNGVRATYPPRFIMGGMSRHAPGFAGRAAGRPRVLRPRVAEQPLDGPLRPRLEALFQPGNVVTKAHAAHSIMSLMDAQKRQQSVAPVAPGLCQLAERARAFLRRQKFACVSPPLRSIMAS